jgi:LacI family transcriptional regulator
MVTLKMLAEETGLSIAAVSKALNHQPGISEKNAQIVRAAAKRLNYYPNGAARTLKTQRSYNIGIVYQNSMEHEYFSRMLGAIRQTCEANGYDLTFLSDRGVSDYGYAAHAMRRNCDGVLVAQGNIDQDDLERLAKSPLAVVSVDRVFEGRTCVWNENTESVKQIVNYVADRGHTRIAFIHGEMGAVTLERIVAFRAACAARGIEVPDEYVVEARFQHPKDSGLATHQLMALPTPPTCILFPDDISYLGGMTELERLGKSIPGDVSCVGYDGIRLASLLRPKLTTYRQDAEAAGRFATEELFCAIEQGKAYKPRKIVVPGAVQEGATVADLT